MSVGLCRKALLFYPLGFIQTKTGHQPSCNTPQQWFDNCQGFRTKRQHLRMPPLFCAVTNQKMSHNEEIGYLDISGDVAGNSRARGEPSASSPQRPTCSRRRPYIPAAVLATWFRLLIFGWPILLFTACGSGDSDLAARQTFLRSRDSSGRHGHIRRGR